MTTIRIEPADARTFRVRVEEGRSATTHEVTVPADALARLGAPSAEALLEASFRFLLAREPKESILPRFDLDTIARYFPEYPKEIERYLRRS